MLERVWGKGSTPLLRVGVQTGTATLDTSMAISQKIRQQTTKQYLAIPPLSIYLKHFEFYHKDMYSTLFREALFVIDRTWK